MKQRQIDVQVIIDEKLYTTFNTINPINHMDQFLVNRIDLLVYPSQQFEIGLMHNKFVVRDNEHIFTGSANFTKSGLFNAQGDSNNYENVVVIHNSAIARKYQNVFQGIKQDIFEVYVQIMADFDRGVWEGWFINLLPKLPQNKLQEAARKKLQGNLHQDQRNRLQQFFGLPVERERKPLSPAQVNLLQNKGYSPEEIENIEERTSEMSAQERFNFVGRLPRKQYQFAH